MDKIFIGDYDKKKYIDNQKKIYIVGDEIEGVQAERIAFKDSIMYRYYFKWLSELNADCTLVLNNILKKKQRTSLEYNCIRHYCKQAGNVIVFSDFPLIDSKDDFMILYDMIQPEPFLKIGYNDVPEFDNVCMNLNIQLKKTDIVLTEIEEKDYEKLKNQTIADVKKDPDIIPRRLLKFAEKCKSKYGRFDSLNELKTEMNVAVSQLKVDQYFYAELQRKVAEIDDIRNKLHGEKCT